MKEETYGRDTENDGPHAVISETETLIGYLFENDAISQEQYNKSLGDLTDKMGMKEILENSKESDNQDSKIR